MLAMLGVLFWIWFRQPKAAGLSALIWSACIILPLLPIFWRFQIIIYYLWLVGLLIAIGVGFALQYLIQQTNTYQWKNIFLTYLVTALLSIYLSANIQNHIFFDLYWEDFEAVQRKAVIYDDSPDTVIVYDSYTVSGLLYVREHVLNNSQTAEWCPVIDCECAMKYVGKTAMQFQDRQWQSERLVPEECGDPERQLSIQLNVSTNKISWQLGPYTNGQYKVAFFGKLPDQKQLATYYFGELPTQGSSVSEHAFADQLQLVLSYQSPDGWSTYSPLLDFDQTTDLCWQKHSPSQSSCAPKLN